VGSEREPRRTRLRAWPGLGRPGRGSPAVAVLAAAERHWKQCSGEGETQKNGGLASGDPRATTYRGERVREGR
jgi:hypothetical protein